MKKTALTVALIFLCVFPRASISESADVEIAAIKRTGEAFVQISKKVTPSVVNIKTYKRAVSRRYDFNDGFFGDMFEPFREFFGRDFGERFTVPDGDKMIQTGLGSGVIVHEEGIVLTNNHVIEGAEKIQVTLADRTELEAQVVGSDPRTDIAVLRLPEGKYTAAGIGNSDAIEVGEWVVAIGNPFGLGQSVTVGVVSAKGRANVGIADFEDFIQTDAAINPGNSGGPLIDLDGAVVGINTAIFSRSGGYQGIGFAVPSNMAVVIMESLLKKGTVIRSDLAMRVQDATEEILKAAGLSVRSGVIVTEVLEGGVANKAGIYRGDIITRVKGREVVDSESYYRIVSLLPVGEKVAVVLFRDNMPRTFMVEVGQLPARPRDSEVRLRTALGFSVEELTEDLSESLGYRYEQGVLITRVTRMSTADNAGLEPGDLVVGINGESTPNLDVFREKFGAVEWNEEIVLGIKRGEKSLQVRMVLKQ